MSYEKQTEKKHDPLTQYIWICFTKALNSVEYLRQYFVKKQKTKNFMPNKYILILNRLIIHILSS